MYSLVCWPGGKGRVEGANVIRSLLHVADLCMCEQYQNLSLFLCLPLECVASTTAHPDVAGGGSHEVATNGIELQRG
jgi:hypothetical protein